MADAQGKNRWVEVKIRCDGELAEALAEVLGHYVVNGIVIESLTAFDPYAQENVPTGELDVSGYLAVNEDLEGTRQKLEEALWHLGQIMPVPEPVFTFIDDENWMAAWRKHYHPIPIGQSLLIMPAWEDEAATQPRIAVRINPAMAFGTGTHPTTQLCLRLLENHMQPGLDLIDVGCGSGILSIAALKLGAARALAVDIDGQAVRSTLENAELNEIPPEQLTVGKGSVEEILTGRFNIQKAPLVLANILAPIILRLFGQGLGELVQESGLLLLSGILDHQEASVLEAAGEMGFTLKDRLTDADWVSLAMVKKHTEQQ